jgi:peptidoglycan/xylan/chitin deacetylase (PgdA/CDA1 family)
VCFHGFDVATAPSRSPMHVPLASLETTVAVAQGLGTIVPLRDLVTRHAAGRDTAGLVALTADDAYASLLAAEPILIRGRVPLTVFVVSGALASGRTFWWDRLDDVGPIVTPARWRRFEDDCGLPDAYRHGQPAHEGPLRPMRQWLLAEHAGRWPEPIEAPMHALEHETGQRTAQRSMTEPELTGFVARTGVQIGVHTISHCVLPLLSDEEMKREIAGCHAHLRARFADTLPYLAVPYGLFDRRTLRLAAEAGMTASLTLAGASLPRRPDSELGVPRFCVVRGYRPGIVALKLSGVSAVVDRLRGRATTPYPPLPSATT